MDLTSGLTAFGKYLSDRTKPDDAPVHTSRVKRSQINTNNIYNSHNVKKNKRFVKGVANKRYKKSRKPRETGIVPNFYNQVEYVNNRDLERWERFRNRQKEKNAKRIDAMDRSKNPRKKILEGFTNNDTDSTFSDDGSIMSNVSNKSCHSRNSIDIGDHMAFFKKSAMIRDNRKHTEKFMAKPHNNGEPGYASQFQELTFNNPGDPVSSNNIHHETGKYGDVSRLETERKLALDGNFSNFNNTDMTYGIVDKKDFVHNNMVPFFNRGVGKGYEQDSIMQKKWNDIKQRKLERFTGSVKNVEYRPKTERRPLFNPQVGLTWIYGMPNFTNYFETRYIPGRERRNEKPFQPVRTTPGLNHAYNEVSKQGFHDTFRALPRTVDELRTANNPKISYGSVVIPGLKYTRRPIVPHVAKRRPVRFKENDPRDFIKGTTYYRAPSIHGNYDAPSTNRQETTRAWYSAAKFNETLHKPDSMYEQVRISHKENFLYDAGHNVKGVGREKNTSHTSNSYHVDPTMRDLQGKRTWLNPAGPEFKKHHAFDMHTNAPAPTCRDLTQYNTYLRPTGTEWKKGNAFDMNTNIPDPTLRDLTQNVTHLRPAGPEWKKGNAFDMHSNIPNSTCRDLTQNNTYLRPAGPEYKKDIAFDRIAGIPDPTLKDITQNKTYQGPLGYTESQKGGYHAQNIIVPATLRQVTQNKTWQAPLGYAESQKGGYHAQNVIAPTTLRQTIQNKTWQAPLGHNESQRGGYHAQNIIVPTTLRQTTQNVTQYGPLAHTEHQQGAYQINVQNTVAPTTLKQLTQNVTQYGPLGNHDKEKGGYQVEVQNTIAPTTLRQLTQNVTQYGPLGNADKEKGGYQVEVQNTIAPATLRQLTQNVTQYGPLGNADKEKGGYQVEVQNTIAPTTLRQLTQNVTRYNPLGQQDKEKGGYQVEVQNTVAPTTLKQMTQKVTQLNPAYMHDKTQGAYQINVQNTHAPTTLRQMTAKVTQLNPAYLHEKTQGAYQINQQNTVAPTTLRQLTQFKTHNNPAILHEGTKTRSRNDITNSLVNIAKEAAVIARDSGAPTTSNYDKGPTFDYTMVELCEPIQVNRNLYPNMEGQRPLQCVPTMYTRIANVLPQQSWRFDTCITENLKTNPFVNNTQHKSVEYSTELKHISENK